MISALYARAAAIIGQRPDLSPSPVGFDGGIPLHKFDQQVARQREDDDRANATARPREEEAILERLAERTKTLGPWDAALDMDWSR